MGNSSKAKASSPLDLTRRRGRKKKGRPSLVDLKKRALRLQKEREQEQEQESLKRKRGKPNPTPTPSNSIPDQRVSSPASGRRSTRRNANPSTSDQEEDDEENRSRKEKKLQLVLDAASNSPDRVEKETSGGVKATDEDAERSEPGPTTPLPDKKLLISIIERVQKKDRYGVFLEPVDPEELPDYHDIIEHPMDFGTIQKKLDKGEYTNLEQFESDVFLVCSNAMVYNASDTIYYRQARTIEELAKKDFANLRTPTENREQEPKPAPRRGRPPLKKPGRPPAVERAAPDPSPDVVPSDAGPSGRSSNFLGQDLARKQPDKAAIVNPPNNLFALRDLENNWSSEHRLQNNDGFSASGFKEGWSKWGKKLIEFDTSRRSTYDHPIPSDSVPPILTNFDSERKLLIPVGIHQPHAYSRSLARFAAKLSPAAWKIVAKRLEQVLPPGTKFGRSWVGETEAPQETNPPK